jgi:hypothetical protein
MGSLPTVHRFYSEDYKTAPQWFQEQFLKTLNLYTDPIYNILNAGVDVRTNTSEELYSFTISNASATPANNALTFTPQKFVGKPNGIIIGQCLANTPTVTPIGAPVTLDWVFIGSQVKIIAVYGLSAGISYNFLVRIF